ncbi:MAG: triose-phosphate isomerase [Bacteroidota bacterium]
MRKNVAAGNWKMNTTLSEGSQLASEAINMIKDEVLGDTKVIFGVPFTHLSSVASQVKEEEKFEVAAQNCSDKESGAYTGETSGSMIASTGAKYVILGHSERREYFGETDNLILEKMRMVFSNDLSPIYCCGEKLESRESGEHFTVVKEQLSGSILKLSKEEVLKTIIAYEPVWAIGTGKTASAEQAQEMHAFIRGLLTDKFGKEVSEEISILYGGSVKPDNATQIFAGQDVDGGLIGGASLKSRDFTDIAKAL